MIGQRAQPAAAGRRLCAVMVMDAADHTASDLDTKVALIQRLIPLGLMHVQETLEAEVEELDGINQSAAASLREGLEEILTLHRLGVFAKLGRSFKTTNCLENVNGLVEERCAKVDCWKNSNQRHRWLATALLDIEPRLRTVAGFRHLPALREALQRELKVKQSAGALAKAA